MKKVTLKEIAQKLGVTVGTVSHVLNGIDDISQDTKERVLRTAKEMGYIQNVSAVSLRSGRSNTIAIIIPDVSNPHLSNQVKLIEEGLRACNYTAVIFNTNEDEEAEYNAIVTAVSRNVDGILLCPSQQSSDNIKFLQNVEVPYVLIGRCFADGNSDYVTADDFEGGRLAGEWLIEKGYKKPVYIGAYKYIESSTLRFDGLCAAFKSHGAELEKGRFIETSTKGDGNKDAFKRLSESGIEYDSIVAFSDFIAFEFMSMVGKNIPVIGFDAINLNLHVPFSYISVGMSANGWADIALDVLFKKISGETKTFRMLCPVKIYEF